MADVGEKCCATLTTTQGLAHGPGYKSPLEAFHHGQREKVLFVTTVNPRQHGVDAVAVVDVDPDSPTYSTVIGKCPMPHENDELHHFGWNSCSSCYHDSTCVRDKLILPCLKSDRIYAVDISDNRNPKIVAVVEDLRAKYKVSVPHTVHCLPTKEILISCMGDENGDNKGSLILIDATTFTVKGFWTSDFVSFGYDFWYQPRHNVLVSSEWGSPNAWKKGLDLKDVNDNKYGHHLHFFDWSTKRLVQSLDLGEDGKQPLEVRFFHDPEQSHGFVGCAFSSTVYHFYLSDGKWKADKVIQVKSKKVENWLMEEMPAVITDIILSLDDKNLFISNWIQGDIRQYEVSDPSKPVLIASIFLGGSLCNDSRVKVLGEDGGLQERASIAGKKVRGGPQMVQLSLDGRRLYVTDSLFSAWDNQFYPDIVEKGSMMMLVDVDRENNKLTLNQNFLIDFGQEPDGPMLAHEMRYPGGDCTSDIWL